MVKSGGTVLSRVIFGDAAMKGFIDRRASLLRVAVKPVEMQRLAMETLRYGQCDYNRGRYAVGNELWIAETWKPWPNTAGPEVLGPDDMGFIYRSTWNKAGGHHWQSAATMPIAASRYRLRITATRIEQLQNLTREDVRKEGVLAVVPSDWTYNQHYRSYWDSTHMLKEYQWAANPAVRVVEFERIALQPLFNQEASA